MFILTSNHFSCSLRRIVTSARQRRYPRSGGPQRTQRITGNAFQISLQPVWQINNAVNPLLSPPPPSPIQIRPLPLIRPPFKGKKVNRPPSSIKPPLPSPNYSLLINDRLY